MRRHAETLQKREATIALAVLDIYVLDFVINIGEHQFGEDARRLLMQHSTIDLSSTGCGHAPSREAAAWVCMGYGCSDAMFQCRHADSFQPAEWPVSATCSCMGLAHWT